MDAISVHTQIKKVWTNQPMDPIESTSATRESLLFNWSGKEKLVKK